MKTFADTLTIPSRARLLPLSLSFGLLSVLFSFGAEAAAPQITQLNALNSTPATNQAAPVLVPEETNQRNAELTKKLAKTLDRNDKSTNVLKQLSPRQRKAAANLIQQTGSDIRLRLRPGSKTVRYLKIADAGKKLKRATPGLPPTEASLKQTAQAFLQENNALLNINAPADEFVLFSQKTDNLGYTHLRYHQQFQNIPVWPADATVHLDPQGDVELFEGAYIATPSRVAVKPKITADEAKLKAKAAVPNAESAEVSDATLIFYALDDKPVRLAWKQEVNVSMIARWLVVIDALDGSVLTAFNQVMNSNVKGSGTDLFGVKRVVNVWGEGGKYYTIDTSKKMYDTNSNPPDLDKTKGAIEVLDANHSELDDQGSISLGYITSTNPNAWSLKDSVSASFAISKTYDYYLSRHQRNSLDGEGGSVLGVVRYAQNLENAYWNGSFMAFGDAQAYAGAFDVVGHELTHGITQKTADLVYKNQSGALNEAMSDIFGQSVENFIGESHNWTMGEVLGDPLRDMKNPNSVKVAGYPMPAKMSEFYGPDSPLLNKLVNGDNGGVHINSSIINHAFYYLAEGLTGAIGNKDAEKIFYRALTTHLQSNSQFVDARLACVQSAEELFGANSTQAQMTAKAFDAVEIIEDTGTPTDPNEHPAVTGKDASLFVYFSNGSYFLGRREGNDLPVGVQLSTTPVSPRRPVVSGDGSLAIFVSADNDICFVSTDHDDTKCLGFSGSVYSVAMTPDTNRWAFVFLDNNGAPTNQISVLDLKANTQKTYDLVAPINDGNGSYPIAYADSMDFSSDGKILVYDALTKVTQPGGSVNEIWSMYALDFNNGIFTSLLAPIPGVSVGNPAFAQTTDSVLTFEAADEATGITVAFAGNLISGKVGVIGQSDFCCMLPGFTGDDSAIVYGQYDSSQPTQFSLKHQAVANDWITTSGAAKPWLDDAYAGVIYRRGKYVVPTAQVAASLKELAFGNKKGFHGTVKFVNKGDVATTLGDVSIVPATAKFTLGANSCTGVSLAPSAACSVDVGFLGGAGLLTGSLSVPLVDVNKKLTVALSGGINLKLLAGKITFNVATANKDQFSLSGELTGAEHVTPASIKSVSVVLGKFAQNITSFTRVNGHLKFSSIKPGVGSMDINLVAGTFSISGGKIDLSDLPNTPQVSLRLNKTLACSKPKLNTTQTQTWTFNGSKQPQTTCTILTK